MSKNFNDIDNSMMNYTPDDIKDFGQQFLNRFYFQTVTDQEDNYRETDIDKVRGRVRIRINELHRGLKDNELPWQLPLQGFNSLQGFFSVPQRGQTILILFLHGDMETPYYIPSMSYKQRPYMNKQEKEGNTVQGGDLNQGQNKTADDEYETSLKDPEKLEDREESQDKDKLKIYDFLPMDMVYENWDGTKFGTDEGIRYNHQRMCFHMPPQWTDNDWIDGSEGQQQGMSDIEDFMHPDQTQYYDDGRSGREFLDWYPQQKVAIEDIDWSRLKTIERPRFSDENDLLIKMPPSEEEISPYPKMRLQLDSWGIMLQDELGNRKQDFQKAKKQGKEDPENHLQSGYYWPDNQWHEGNYKGNTKKPNLQPARMRKMRVYSPLENELKLELDSLLKLSTTGQQRTKSFDNTSNLWGQNVKNFEVWERYWHSKKEKYTTGKGQRNAGGLHEEYLMDYPFFGCTVDKAFEKLLNQEFSPLFYSPETGGFMKGKQKYHFGKIWNCPDEEQKHHVLVKYPEEWHIRDQVQNNDNHYDDFRRDEILKQTNPFSWKKELFFQTKDFTREQKKWNDQKYLEFYNEVDFKTQEHQAQGQTSHYDTSGGDGYSKLQESFFDFVLNRNMEQYQYNPDKENPDGGKMEGTEGNGFSGGGPAVQRFGEKEEFLAPFKYKPEKILSHDSPVLTKVYSFDPEKDKHFYKQDILNVLRQTPTNEFGTNWSERLEDRYKKEFHSFRPDLNDHKIEYWEKENVFFQQDWYQLLEEKRKIYQPDQMQQSADTNNVEQKQYKDISNETQDWHKLDVQDSTRASRDFWKHINMNVNSAEGTPRVGKLDDEFVNDNDPQKYKELQSTFTDEYMNHHEDHYTWDKRKRDQQWYRDAGIASPFFEDDYQDLNQLKWEFKVKWNKQDVYYKDPMDWQMNTTFNHKRIQIKKYEGEEEDGNFYEGFDRQYHDSDQNKLVDKRKQPKSGKGPYINNLYHDTINYKEPEDWFTIKNNDSMYMVDSSDYYVEKNNHFQTRRDTQENQSLELKNRKYNVLAGGKDKIKDEHIFDTKRPGDMFHFRYRRQNKFNLVGLEDKQESHTDKKYFRYDTDTLMHQKVDFEVFNSLGTRSIEFDENYTIYNDTDDSTVESEQNNSTSITLDTFSTYYYTRKMDLYNDESFHVDNYIKEEYHPDQKQFKDYHEIKTYDNGFINEFDNIIERHYEHGGSKYNYFYTEQKEYDSGTSLWEYNQGVNHDVTGGSKYLYSLDVPNTKKLQYFNVYESDTGYKDENITEMGSDSGLWQTKKYVLFENEIKQEKTYQTNQGSIYDIKIRTQNGGRINNWTTDMSDNENKYWRNITSNGSTSEITYIQTDTVGMSKIEQKSGEINTSSEKDTSIQSDININETQTNNINLTQTNDINLNQTNNVTIQQGNEIIIEQNTKITIKQPDIVLEGNTEIKGNLHVTGDITCDGTNPPNHEHPEYEQPQTG